MINIYFSLDLKKKKLKIKKHFGKSVYLLSWGELDRYHRYVWEVKMKPKTAARFSLA